MRDKCTQIWKDDLLVSSKDYLCDDTTEHVPFRWHDGKVRGLRGSTRFDGIHQIVAEHVLKHVITMRDFLC